MAGRTKKPVGERMAIAEAKKAATDMGASAAQPCRWAIEGAVQAAQWMGRAQARLSDDHPEIRSAYSSYAKSLDRIIARCGEKK